MPEARDIVLGKYELLDELNSGGNAQVWKALRKVEGKSEFVAVKILFNRPGEEIVVQQMFDNEKKVLQTLQGSKNIAAYIDSGFDKKCQSYCIVIEYFDMSLDEKLEEDGPFQDLDQWKEACQDLISAVEIAHRRGIEHRDLKPANIMIRPTSSETFDLVLIDFGIADVALLTDKQVTVKNYRTPFYSPGDFANYDQFARDIFSLVAIFIRMFHNQEFNERENLYLVYEKIKNSDLVPASILNFFDTVIHPKKSPISSISIFRTNFLRSLQSANLSSQIRIPIYVGPQVLAKLKNLHDELDAKEIAMSFQSGGVTAVFKVAKGELDDQVVYLLKNRIQFSCRVSEVASASYFEAYAVNIIDPDLNDIKLANGQEIDTTKFKLVFGQNLAGLGTERIEDLLELLKPEEKALQDKPELEEKLDLYRRMIEARKAALLGNSPSIQYSNLESHGRRITVEFENLAEIPELNTVWAVQGQERDYFELVAATNIILEFETSAGPISLPREGRLIRSLGLNGSSFKRQLDAIERIKDGGIQSSLVSQVLENLDAASVENLQHTLSFFNELDLPKQRAVELALSSQDICVVQGPPGTGKTQFIVELVQQLTQDRTTRPKILIVSQTHIAVDNAIQRLRKSGFDSIIRIGRDEKIANHARDLVIDKRLDAWKVDVRERAAEHIEELARKSNYTVMQLEKACLVADFVDVIKSKEAVIEVQQHTPATALSTQIEDEIRDLELDERKKPNEVKLDEDVELLIKNLSRHGFRERELRSALSNGNVQGLDLEAGDVTQLSNLVELYKVQRDWLRRFGIDKELKQNVVKRTTLFAGTCVGFISAPYIGEIEFDVCIIDEASKATTTELLVAMSRSRKVILVGDSNQLPPNDEELLRNEKVLREFSLAPEDITHTLFEELSHSLPEESKAMLNIQYRMDPPIGDLVSQSFYKGLLNNGTSAPSANLIGSIGPQVQWHDTSRMGERRREQRFRTSYQNSLEVEVLISFLQTLLSKSDRGELGFDRGYVPEFLIIAPYAKQVQEIRRALSLKKVDLSSIKVETIDAVQGLEADFALISVTRSNSRGEFGFVGKNFWRRHNVALSRAKHGLFIFGDGQFVTSRENGFATAYSHMLRNPSDCQIIRLGS
jgi:hypothetical protein